MTITLKNDELTVQLSEFGAALTSIKDKDGLEYLWQGNPEYWSSQAPVLFPICGSLRMNWTVYRPADRPHFTGSIPRHGLVRKEYFIVDSISEDTVTFSIRPTEKMLRAYPYHFHLSITYRLSGKRIQTTYQVANEETSKTLPYFIGGHPGFNCPLLEMDKYEDYYLEFDEEETCSIPRSFPDTGLLDLNDRLPFLNQQKKLDLDYRLFTRDALTLDRLQSRGVTLRSRKHHKGVRLDFPDFPYLVLWSTVNQSPFIALEPWSGLSTSLDESDYFEDKRNVSLVAPQQTDCKSFSISIL
ncbi:aldose 1-epimerase family protein [Streptococcus tangpeifui]|uniref:aldose 1-epimerase family protein n=1 Tax=Streptococcus tangpeifui TaxID=2709400 RepID=UPI0013EB9C97|nr:MULTISPECIES: aldose 1-epimerase family protein [unclassified Streptococcus]